MTTRTPLCFPLVAATLWAQGPLFAQSTPLPTPTPGSAHDEEALFGDTAPAATSPAPQSSATSTASGNPLADNTTIGGKLRLETGAEWDPQKSAGSQTFDQKTALSLYLDSRPNADLRGFVRGRFVQSPEASEGEEPKEKVAGALEEAWIKWDWSRVAFFTWGIQKLKWGSGTLWNPTDFFATSTRNPLATQDIRTGARLLKIHLPVEKCPGQSGKGTGCSGNFYAVWDTTSSQATGEMRGGLRGEIVLGGTEWALSAVRDAKNKSTHLGADLSTGLGPWLDGHVEAAFVKAPLTLWTGNWDSLSAENKKDVWTQQIVVGLEASFSNNDVIVGTEYFENGRGQNNAAGEYLAVFSGQNTPLMAPQKSAGAWLRLQAPASLSRASLFVATLSSLTDKTGLVQLNGTVMLKEKARLGTEISRPWGRDGVYAISRPKTAPQDPNLSPIASHLPENPSEGSLRLFLEVDF